MPLSIEAEPHTSPDQLGTGWHPDPSVRHELRYFDGQRWTDHVTHSGPVPCTGCTTGGEGRPAARSASDPAGLTSTVG